MLKALECLKDEPVNFYNEIVDAIPFITTPTFSASEFIDGPKFVVYYENNKWESLTNEKTFDHDAVRLIMLLEDYGKLERMNPGNTHVFSIDPDNYYIIDISDSRSGKRLSEDRINFIARGINFKVPDFVELRCFDDAKEWVKKNNKTLMLKYDNGFMLKMTPESLQ